jgi:hypothetical protein
MCSPEKIFILYIIEMGGSQSKTPAPAASRAPAPAPAAAAPAPATAQTTQAAQAAQAAAQAAAQTATQAATQAADAIQRARAAQLAAEEAARTAQVSQTTQTAEAIQAAQRAQEAAAQAASAAQAAQITQTAKIAEANEAAQRAQIAATQAAQAAQQAEAIKTEQATLAGEVSVLDSQQRVGYINQNLQTMENQLFGFNQTTPTIQQFTNRCRAFHNYNVNSFYQGLRTNVLNYSLVPSVNTLRDVFQNWINTETTSIDASVIQKLYNILYVNSDLNNNMKNYIKNDGTNNIMTELLQYVSDNPNLTEAELVSYIRTYVRNYNPGEGSTQQTYNYLYPYETFTNYVKKSNNYSRISVDNGSSIWHSKLTGAPFSPKV